MMLRNDETIISSISVTDIFFDVYLGKWNYRAIPKVKTWSYFLTIPKFRRALTMTACLALFMVLLMFLMGAIISNAGHTVTEALK